MRQSHEDGDARLRRIIDAEWLWRTQQFDGRSHADYDAGELWHPLPFLPDVSPEAHEARRAHWADVVASEQAIPEAELSPDARVERAVHTWDLRTRIAQIDWRKYERPADADSGFWTDHLDLARQELTAGVDAASFIEQLHLLPRWFAQQVANMRAGLRRGFAPPRVSMVGRSAPVRAAARAASPEQSAYAGPFRRALGRGVIDQGAWERALRVIEGDVLPAYRALAEFLDQDYLPNLPTSIAAADQPDGREFYQAQVREYATLDMDPRDIVALGKESVAALRERMREVASRTGFRGDVAALIAHMRGADRFYATTPHELLAEAAWQAKRFDGVAARWFGLLPRGRFAIAEPPADLAPYYTFGRGGPGIYLVNTYNLRARPLYSLPALTLHEAAPGHAFQMALAAENSALLPYRRDLYTSAFGEGWALYCERLGADMGLFADDFEYMGMLGFQAWRAARLVIDPGIHLFGWSRQRAIDYLLENTAIAPHEAETEVDRYIAWPGQATAYYIGEREILRLRERARAALGGRFDVRAFHDVVLSLGCVPLPVLRDVVEGWIDGLRREAA